ncbi:DEAD/DEAH box helicase [Paenisporosarcina indica]|uniref:DEAD/DEAH box helicase n=1 Tax=Paenisporosarcina indica TaxID=650093 RepID=UPI000A4DC753|nr:AAA domain-containing protein [Paenisporosarcina indica]
MTALTASEPVIRCELSVTDKVERDFFKWAKGSRAFLHLQKSFYVHIEKQPNGKYEEIRVSLYVDPTRNKKVSEVLGGGTAVMECTWTGKSLQVNNFFVTKKKSLTLGSNRQYSTKMELVMNGSVPTDKILDLYTILKGLPIASERSDYVRKRISSWNAYLQIMEKNADVAELELPFQSARLNKDFSQLTLEVRDMPNGIDRNYRSASAKLVEAGQVLGKVSKINKGKRSMDIDLDSSLSEKARKGIWQPAARGKLSLSNMGELSLVRRLKDGFRRLENGLSANPNLDKLLFEERPRVTNGKVPDMTYKQPLNSFQQEAVNGAMAANDLYVIQGPPGTGKTTVITEICYQNAKQGLKTLVASQSNLAVDNALGKLMTDKEIRILRIGRPESIEEEGQKFVEDQVALYWKQQTVTSIGDHVNAFEKDEGKIRTNIEDCEATLEQLADDLVELQEKLKRKSQAQEQKQEFERQLKVTQDQSVEWITERNEYASQLPNLQERLVKEQESLILATDQVERFSGTGEFSRIQNQLVGDIKLLQDHILLAQLEQSLRSHQQDRTETAQKLEEGASRKTSLTTLKVQLKTVTKIENYKVLIRDMNLFVSQDIVQLVNQLDRVHAAYKSHPVTKQFEDDVSGKLNNAIKYVEEKLNHHQYNMKMLHQKIKSRSLLENASISDQQVEKILNALRIFTRETKQFQVPMSQQNRQKLARYFEEMVVIRTSRGSSKGGSDPRLAQLRQEAIETFDAIKSKTDLLGSQHINQLETAKLTLGEQLKSLDYEIDNLSKSFNELKQRFPSGSNDESSDEMKRRLSLKEETLNQLGTEEHYVRQLQQVAAESERSVAILQKEIDQLQLTMENSLHQISTNQSNQLILNKQLEAIEEIVAEDVESQLNKSKLHQQKTTQELDDLKRKEKLLAVSNDIRLEWTGMLEESTEYDLNEIKKLYIRYANVIGVTCAGSARKDFINDYPDFDVVIIDEVSKATPPELLLPMLKGKKVILVGDHHQLPPLIGQETMEETLENMENREEKAELKAILEESIFERLFKALRDTNKTTLRIQYRMHENIMETINPFYQEKNYGLQCGLKNSDVDRDHLLDGELVKRGQHLLWFDMPHKQGYFEEQDRHSRSYYNSAELKQIRALLLDLDQSVSKAIQQGRMGKGTKKKVGIISFYGDQVKKVDRMLSQELNLPHLHCRTGSVDKFQGMEMDVIILSFVRNHEHPEGNIGFLKDYRRLNVALSRARELMLIVGSVEMFTQKAKGEAQRNMFTNVRNVVEKHGGLKQHQEIT